jgi:2-polyprenyl-3-methyl-5-hydroxy-6-metoxy-1,4-benzoquinol methylase
MDDVWRRIYNQQLLSGFIGLVDGLPERLQQGVRVLDVGCGTGHAMNILAQEFPSSRFYGYDIAEDAIESARAEAENMNLTNVSFEVLDVTNLPKESKYDVITAFDTIHDQKDPDSVLRGINQALAPGGMFLMIDFKFSSHVEENIKTRLHQCITESV